MPVSDYGLLTCPEELLSKLGRQQRAKLLQAAVTQLWRLLMLLVLNGEFCNWDPDKISPGLPLHRGQELMIETLTARASRFAEHPLLIHSPPKFDELIRAKSIDYNGEEVSTALPLVLAELLPGLPDPGVAGSLHASDVVDEEVGRWLNDPVVTLKNQVDWPDKVPSARINAQKQEWHRICLKLLELGILAEIAYEEIFQVDGQPILNGAFAVEKKGVPAPGQCRVTRLIMNLVPSNSYQVLQKGDLNTLSPSTGWGSIVMKPEHVLLWSSDDQKGAFYAWKLPPVWRKFMAFKWPLPGALLGRKSSWVYVASAVIPMGWLQAVSLFQHLHRQIGVLAGHDPSLEWRRDRASPLRSDHTVLEWYQFYLDDFDCPQLVPVETWPFLQGTLSQMHAAQRAAYDKLGVGISKGKEQLRQPVVVRMGCEVDGIRGTVSAPSEKLLDVCYFSLWLLGKERISNKSLLMCLGRWVRCFEFRRPLMSLLENCWPRTKPSFCAPLKNSTMRCILHSIAMVGLAFANIKAEIDGMVSCSDASEAGGGLCVSGELTTLGENMLSSLQSDISQDRRMPFSPAGAMSPNQPVGPKILVISLFDGIGAVMCALCRLPCQVVGYVSSEIDKECKRLVRRRWPGVLEVGSILDFTDKTMEAIYVGLNFKIDLVLVVGGSPCQELDGPRSRLFFQMPKIFDHAKKRFRCRVELMVENVFSMTKENRKICSTTLGLKPYLVDSIQLSWCRRPRFFWVSWVISPVASEVLVDHGDYFEWIFPDVKGSPHHWVDDGWQRTSNTLMPTQTRAVPRTNPPLAPAGLDQASPHAIARWEQDGHRFQVDHYEDAVLLVAPGHEPRLPSLLEKENLMGFDPGYVSNALPPKMHPDVRYNLGSCMLGNSFHVHVAVMLMHSMLSSLFERPLERDHAYLVQKVIDAPPGWTSCSTIAKSTLPDSRSQALVQEIMRQGDRAGTDVRLDVGIPFKFKSYPRAGIKASMFKWRIVHGYKWKHTAHINVLELHAVINAIQWRLRKVSGHRKRILHLVDSQVVASVVAKGRTSSFRLRLGLKKLNALLLGSGITLCVGYIHTSDNPSDIPSRWASAPQKHKGKDNAKD